MRFDDNLFFYFILPPIVFASGFNMYRKKFFANIANILLFGVVVRGYVERIEARVIYHEDGETR